MATQKRTKKKRAKASRTAGKKVTPTRNKRKLPKKKTAKEKAVPKKAAVKTRAAGKRIIAGKTMPAPKKPKKQLRRKGESVDTVRFSLEEPVARPGAQSGDLQGLSRLESAGSQSVDELLEEGNAFEADAVMGVEQAGNAEGREVHTQEVPEDDVPGEYLDKD